MEEYLVKVLCADGACDSVREYMERNGYRRVRKKAMAMADHVGILESTDLDAAVETSRRIKEEFGDRIVGLKLVPPP